jgi:threonine dehydratase
VAEQAPDVRLVLVPIGGGGLAAGVATAVTGLLPATSVIGVEPVIASDTSQSIRAGRRVSIPEPDTIADGLRAREPGELTFAVNSRLLTDVVTVTEDDIIDAMWFCFTRLKLVVEPSGAVPLAALLSGAVTARGHTVVVLSGGNIDPADFSALTGARQTA